MKIRKLKLRGAIGIRKGLGLEEIEIDFSQYQSGLIALTGRNGSGKTTIMENLHPYRMMVSRDGSLQNHFYLKDSFRILEFEQDGDIYESKILIDALTGGSEAYLLKNTHKGYNPLNDGKLTTYDKAIEDLLGSPDLFFNSVFSGQKSKGIAELKPADRRKLFYELLNLNIYEQYLEQAKVKAREQEVKLSAVEGEIKALQQSQTSLDVLDDQRVELLNDQVKIISDISNLETRIDELKKEISDLTVKVKLAEDKRSRNKEYQDKIDNIGGDILSLTTQHNSKIIRLTSEIDDNKKLLERNKKLATPEAKEKVRWKLKEIESLKQSLSTTKDYHSGIQKQYSDHQKEYSEKLISLGELEKKVNTLRSEFNALKSEAETRSNEIKRYEESIKIIDEVPCDQPTGSSCKFLINAYGNKESLPGLNEALKKIDENLSFKEAELVKAEKQLRTDKQMIDEQFTLKDQDFKCIMKDNETEIEAVNKKLAELTKDNWEKLNEDLKEAGNNIKLLEEKIKNTQSLIDQAVDDFNRSIESLKVQANELTRKIDNNIDLEIRSVEKSRDMKADELDKLSRELKTSQDLLSSYERQIATLDKEIETIKQNEERIAKLNETKREIESEIKDWSFLVKAFDKTGIPVLKLENSGIEITSVANELLSIFENKFRIVFETTKLKADKKSYKESFDINIVEDDGVCEISNKSGGQQVWLETAIQLAISLVVRNQGRNIETAFLDEKDGALDLENAYSYIEMLRRAHQLSGVHNTFIITHRPELLDFIPQQVKLTDGVLEVVNG
ncbi:MAG: SMC family ATPase [Ignavibacterium sp.]|nr:SMC family ATPase [Ignavibacterium sp.]